MARLRPLLLGLVSPLQTAFVPGRKGVYNAIIMQEIIHSMYRKRVGVAKLDMICESNTTRHEISKL